MFRYRRGKAIVDSSIWSSIESLQGLDDVEKKIIYSEIMNGLDMDIKEFEDRLSIPDQSGPSIWDFLHWMGKVADDEKNPDVYLDALSVVERGHPCANVCRKHLIENLKVLPTTNFSSMFRHSYELHNLVNKQLGKRIFPLKQAMSNYNIDCDTCVFGAKPNARSMH